MRGRIGCDCFAPVMSGEPWPDLRLHDDRQDVTCDAWKRLVELVELAAEDGREEFRPGLDLGRADWLRIVTLPPDIAKLKRVKRLHLYGSALVRIPPEIGEMTALEEFDPYTSYRLHWFPYEITRCRRLRASTVSTRALYGNRKFRPPFPRLPQRTGERTPPRCSVCGGLFGPGGPIQRWISLRVATDVLPLLVHACSNDCIARLPAAEKGYVPGPHVGGPGVVQPPWGGG